MEGSRAPDVVSAFEVLPGPRSPLAVLGVPLAKGVVDSRTHLALFQEGFPAPIPVFWEPRASWPDGSFRWLLLHADLPHPGSYSLRTDPGGTPSGLLPDRPAHPAGLTVVPAAGGFALHREGHPVLRWVETGPGDVPLPAEELPEAVLLEASPVSRLVRLRFPARGGFRTEILVRTDDPGAGLEATIRVSRIEPSPDILPERRFRIRFIDAAGGGDASVFRMEGEDGSGRDLRVQAPGGSVTVVDGARRMPCGLEATPDGVAVLLFGDPAPLPAPGGASYRQRIRIRFGDDLPPPEVRLHPGTMAACGALGPLPVLSADPGQSVAPGIASGLRALFEHAWSLAEGGDPAFSGIENFGDWPLSPGQYGSGDRRAYADNEYDMPCACFLYHAATGDGRYLDLARRGAEHMADLDVRCTDGSMPYHGYGDEAEDHRQRRVPGGDMGHVWTDGLWLVHLRTGDPFLRDAAERVTRWVLAHFRSHTLAEEFALCERNLGWPLAVAVAALENGSPELASEARPFVDGALRFLDRYTQDPDAAYEDPAMPVWWRCAQQDGSKPFMLGILNEALERLHRLDGDESSLRILRRLAAFLRERTFDPVRMDFQYEYNAYGPGHRDIPAQQLVPLFVRGLLYVDEPDRSLSEPSVALASFHASAWCLYDASTRGKEIALMARGLIPSLAMVEERHQAALRKRMERQSPSTGRPESTLHAVSPADILANGPGYSTGAGWIRIIYRPETEGRTSHLNRQAFFHASDGPANRSAVCILCFYDRIQVRFHDADRRLVDSLDAFVPDAFFGRDSGTHEILVRFEAPGAASLSIDGRIVSRRILDRPLGGAFRRVRVGRKPGNWGLEGRAELEARFGSTDPASADDDRNKEEAT